MKHRRLYVIGISVVLAITFFAGAIRAEDVPELVVEKVEAAAYEKLIIDKDNTQLDIIETLAIEDKIAKLYMKYRDKNDSAEFLNVKEDCFWTDTRIYNPHAKKLQEAVTKWICKVQS